MNHTRFPREDHLPDWARRDNNVTKGDRVDYVIEITVSHRWRVRENNIKMYLIEWEDAVWIQVAQYREKWRVFVNSVFTFGSRQVLFLTNRWGGGGGGGVGISDF